MKTHANYFLIESSVLPEVYKKVTEAKKLLSSGRVKTVAEAVGLTGVSRSAFYKYKDFVFELGDNKSGVYTVDLELEDKPGVLQEVLAVFAKNGCNVITINQGAPRGSVAGASVTFRAAGEGVSVEKLLKTLSSRAGCLSVEITGTGE